MSESRKPEPEEWFHRSFDEFYPSLYGHRDLGEARGLLDRIDPLFRLGQGRVLDLGCGQGRYLQALQERGAQPIGVDLSMPLILEAHRAMPSVPLVRADMRTLPFRPRSFHSVLLMFTTFGYFSSDEEHLRVLDGVASLVEGGGRFLLDYVNARHLRAHFVPSSTRNAGRSIVFEKRWIDPDGRFLHKESRIEPASGEIGRIYKERLRLYDPAQVDGMLGAAGFRVEMLLGDYDARSFDEKSSPRLIVLARREGGDG